MPDCPSKSQRPAMDVAFTMPDGVAERLEQRWGDLSKRALESIVADAYREEVLTLGEVREALGHSHPPGNRAVSEGPGGLFEMTEDELANDARAAREARSER